MTRARELHASLLVWWDSPGFREKYMTDPLFRNVFDTLTKALGVAAELLSEAKDCLDQDGRAEPSAEIRRFLSQLPGNSASDEHKGTDA
jgi:hypothetical protein